MRSYFPALSYHFHLSPSDIRELSDLELDGYLDGIEQLNNQKG